jgi:hypothetical protein
MIITVWATTVTMAIISLFTSNPFPLIAGLIIAGVGTLIERFYK